MTIIHTKNIGINKLSKSQQLKKELNSKELSCSEYWENSFFVWCQGQDNRICICRVKFSVEMHVLI